MKTYTPELDPAALGRLRDYAALFAVETAAVEAAGVTAAVEPAGMTTAAVPPTAVAVLCDSRGGRKGEHRRRQRPGAQGRHNAGKHDPASS